MISRDKKMNVCCVVSNDNHPIEYCNLKICRKSL